MNIVHNKHSSSSDLEFLKDFPLFHLSNPANSGNNTTGNPVNHDKLIKLATQFKLVQLKSNQLLYSQVDFSNYIYFLVSGTVQLNYRFEQNQTNNLLHTKPNVNNPIDNRLLRNHIQLHKVTLTKLNNKSYTSSSNNNINSSDGTIFERKTGPLSLRNPAKRNKIRIKFNNQNNTNKTDKVDKTTKKDKKSTVVPFQTLQSRVQNLVNSAKKQGLESSNKQHADNLILTQNNTITTTITPEQIHFERLKELEAEFYYYADPRSQLEKSKYKPKTVTSVINTNNTANATRTPIAPIKPKSKVTETLNNHNHYIELNSAEHYYGIVPHPQQHRSGTTLYFRVDISPSNLNCPMRIHLYSTDSTVCIYASHTNQIPMSSDNSVVSSAHIPLVSHNPNFGGKRIYTQVLNIEQTESTCYYLSMKFSIETGYCIYIDCLNSHNTRYDCALTQTTAPAVLGLLELNENQPRYCAVQAVTACELYCIERDTFSSIMKNTTILHDLIRLGNTQLQQYKQLARQKLNLAMKMGPQTTRIQLTQPTFASLPKSIFNISRPHTAQLPTGTAPESVKLDQKLSTPRILTVSNNEPINLTEPYDTPALSPLHEHPRRSSVTYAEFVHTDNPDDISTGITNNFESINANHTPATVSRLLPEKINEFAQTLNSIHELDSSTVDPTTLPEFMLENKIENETTPTEKIKEMDMKWETGEGLQFHRIKVKDIESARNHTFTPHPPSSGPYSARRSTNRIRSSHTEEKELTINSISRPHTSNSFIPLLNFSRITVPMNPISRPQTAKLGLNVTVDTERAERFKSIHLQHEFRPQTALTINKSGYNRTIRFKQQQLLADIEKAKSQQAQLIKQQTVKIDSKPILLTKKRHKKKSQLTTTTIRKSTQQDSQLPTIIDPILPNNSNLNQPGNTGNNNNNEINHTELNNTNQNDLFHLDPPLTTDDLLTSQETFQSELDKLLQDGIDNEDSSEQSSGDVSIDTDDELFELEEQRKQDEVVEKTLEMQY